MAQGKLETSVSLIKNGPGNSSHVVVFAHGAGTAMDAAPLQRVATGLGQIGIDVVRFEFPYMHARRMGDVDRKPDADEILAGCFVDVIKKIDHPGKLVVGGWSLGGRIAVQIAKDVGAAAVVCVSYPFHPNRDPSDRLAVDRLQASELPALIVQGTRDSFGNQQQVRGYRLAQHVQVYWLQDANHALLPRERSGFTASQHLEDAITQLGRFTLEC